MTLALHVNQNTRSKWHLTPEMNAVMLTLLHWHDSWCLSTFWPS